jgi:hypothetical protein
MRSEHMVCDQETCFAPNGVTANCSCDMPNAPRVTCSTQEENRLTWRHLLGFGEVQPSERSTADIGKGFVACSALEATLAMGAGPRKVAIASAVTGRLTRQYC